MKLYEFDKPSMKQLAKQVAAKKATHSANQKNKPTTSNAAKAPSAVKPSEPVVSKTSKEHKIYVEPAEYEYQGKNLIPRGMPDAWISIDDGSVIGMPKFGPFDHQGIRNFLIKRMYDTPLFR